MKNPELYILIALGFSILLNWVTSRFSDLSIGLFNTAIGLLFGVTANLAATTANASLDSGNPAVTDYAWLLALCQFGFGILVVTSHFASKRFNSVRTDNQNNGGVKWKESLFYSTSVMLSLLNCYMMSILFIYSDKIFAPIPDPAGALVIIATRFIEHSPAQIIPCVMAYMLLFVTRYYKENIAQFAHPNI